MTLLWLLGAPGYLGHALLPRDRPRDDRLRPLWDCERTYLDGRCVEEVRLGYPERSSERAISLQG